MRHIIPLGTSEPQDFGLLDNGAAIDGTGLNIAVEVYRKENGVMTLVTANPPTVAWLNQAGGTVRVSGVETLTEGYYYARFKLTDAQSKIGYCPNQVLADVWRVVPIPAES